jgi:hypothetical protein
MYLAIPDLQENYSEVAMDFTVFFDELKDFVQLEKENRC